MIDIIPRGDTSPIYNKRLKNDLGEVIDLTNVTEVSFHMRDHNYNTIVDDNTSGNVEIINAGTGDVGYNLQTPDTDTIGTYFAEFTVEFSDGTVRTFPARDNYKIKIVEDIND